MPIIKSAKKRVRVSEKAAIRNSKTKRAIKSSVKSFQEALKGKDSKKVMTELSKAQSAIDSALKKNVLHKNKAARKKAQLAAQAKAAGHKATKVVKAAAPKKPAAK